MSLDTLGGAWASLGGSWGVLCVPWDVLGGSRGRSPNSFVMYTIEIVMFLRGPWGPVNLQKVGYGSTVDRQAVYHTGGLGPP